MTAADILPDIEAHVGLQARAFGPTATANAIKAAVAEAETLAGVRAEAMTLLPSWLPDPVARIALFILSQTVEGWDQAQLEAVARQYKRAVSVLTARHGTVNADGTPVSTAANAASGATLGNVAGLPDW